jgi:hypothetical protein
MASIRYSVSRNSFKNSRFIIRKGYVLKMNLKIKKYSIPFCLGLVVPQTPFIECLAAQARALPKLDKDTQNQMEICMKALNSAARYPEKDPLHTQVTELRRKLAKKETELRENTVPQSEVSQMHLQLAELSTRVQDNEVQLAKSQEIIKKLTEGKKQGTHLIEKKRWREGRERERVLIK